MRRAAALLVLLLVAAPALGQQPTPVDRFRLFTGCSPLRISVEVQDDENDLGLSEERVETAVRSRLRGARLYYSGPTALDVLIGRTDVEPAAVLRIPILSVWVHVARRAFSIGLEMRQEVITTYTDLSGIASTWVTQTTGTHGQDHNFVLGSVAQLMDGFIDDYLRVNDEAC